MQPSNKIKVEKQHLFQRAVSVCCVFLISEKFFITIYSLSSVITLLVVLLVDFSSEGIAV